VGETTDQKETSSKFKSLGVRAVSGILLMVLCGGPLYLGGWYFTALVGLFTLRMMWEWVRMVDPKAGWLSYSLHLLGAFTAIVYAHFHSWNLAFLAAALTAIFALVVRARRGGIVWAVLGPFYIILPSMAILWLRSGAMMTYSPEAAFKSGVGLAILVFVIIVVVAADSFAYLGGSLLKGPKLAPKISPNKTWSGFISGLICAATVGGIYAHFTHFNPVTGVLLAIPIVIASVAGDFLESYVKRVIGVKDAGGVLPGHGGLLDRVDSLMLAVSLSAVVLYLWPQILTGILSV
jgi:phosphatidate cytidylyltransferase